MRSTGKLPKVKRQTVLFLVMITFVISLSAIIIKGPGPVMPEPDGDDLWKYLTKENQYTEWKQWPGLKDMYKGQSPHGAYLKLFVNAEAHSAIRQGDNTMPGGAILVKENYDKDKKLVAITPMYKVEGYNPEAGNWFWAKYGTNGEIMAEGKVQSCIDCHRKADDNDYLFSESK